MDPMDGRTQRVGKTIHRLLRRRTSLVVVLVALATLSPAAATALRSHGSPSTVFLAQGPGRSAPGEPVTVSKHTAVKAVRGKLNKPTVLSAPTELHLKKAHGAVFDVRTLKSTVVKQERPEHAAPGQAAEESEPATSLPAAIDPNATVSANAAAPAPDANFEGLDFANWGAGHPPDTNGDVGPTYYIQTINSSIGIYDKSDGTRVAAFTFNAFMSQGNFGNVCDTSNFGDPVVLYDSFEDRWFITDFAYQLVSGSVSPPHVFQCFAVSKTADPVNGGWNFYSIESPGGLDDYPKFGVWPDGIYMSANMFGYAAGSSFFGAHVWAINKAQMYAGEPSVQVADFAAPPGDFTLLPANARLQAGTPPAGRPEYFASTWQFLNALTIYKFHVDWDKISTSTFSGPDIPINATSWPNAAVGNAVTPGNALDTLQIRAMAQLQYSNLGGGESLWATHTVRRANTTGFAAPRWYQVDVTGGTVAPNTVQGTTWDPDGANTFYRFMPSLAVDRNGDMALGYSKSSSVTNPQIKYAGRLAGDPVNTFSQDEQTLIDGTGTQVGNCGGATCVRWGDYSGMSLDPDGCTFWETNEYYAVDGLDHHTRIGSFRFPGCTTVDGGTLSGTVSDGSDPISGATVTLGSRKTTTDGSGNYSFSIPAGTYPSLTASKAGFESASASGIAVPDGGTATRDFTLGAAPTSGCFVDNTQSAFQRGLPSGCDLNSSPGAVQLLNRVNIDQQQLNSSGSGIGMSTTVWLGQTFTPAITGLLTRIDLSLFCAGCSGPDQPITVEVRTASGGLPTSTVLATTTIPGFSSGASAFYPATFSTPPTLTAGTQYAYTLHITTARTGTYAAIFSTTPGAYASGDRVSSANSGVTWGIPLSAGTARDLAFKTYIQTGFPSSGTFVSSVKDANPGAGRAVEWTVFSFSAVEPAGTDVQFQVGASNSSYGPFSFVGPDGTASTFFTTSDADLSQFDGFRYLRYKAYLSTDSNADTPTLSDVTACFDDVLTTSLGVDPATGTYGGTTTLSATLTAGGDGVGGKTIDFTLNGTGVGSATTDTNGIATLSGVSLSGLDAGSYPGFVGASFAGDTTHGPSSGSTSLTVGRAELTITANDRSKLYGQSLSLGTTAFTASGLVGSDGIAGVTLTSAGATAVAALGQYAIVPSAAVAGAGTDLDNYSVGYVNGTLTVYLAGVVGIDSVTLSSKDVLDSFDSSLGPYGVGNQGSAATVLSNGAITLSGATVNGDVRSSQGAVGVAVHSTVTGDVTAGTTISNDGTIGGTATPSSPAAPIVAPPVAACSPFSNAAGIGGQFTYNAAKGDLSLAAGKTATLANGSYCFHNVTLAKSSVLTVTAPVAIALTGQLSSDNATLLNTTSVPAKLQISSSFTGKDGVTLTGGGGSYMTVYAPRTSIDLTGHAETFGTLIGKILTVSGNSAVHFDVD